MVAILIVMRRDRLEWFRHIKRREDTENIRAIMEMKMEGKRAWKEAQFALESHYQKGPESLEQQGGMDP